MTPRSLSVHGPAVFPLALGCMGMSAMYGPADEATSLATLHAALDAGVDLLDTGDFYGQGHNEALIARALATTSHRPKLSVKFGALRAPGGAWIGVDGRPAAVKNFAAYSLQRLGVEVIDIYRPARVDPAVPIEDTVGAIADLVRAGYVRHIGLSEVGPETLRRAAAVHPIVDVQLEYSLLSRGPDRGMLAALDELGVGMTAYGVLSRGLLAGSRPTGATDYRAWLPRFQPANLAANQPLVDALAALAAELGTTPTRLAIAWVLRRGPRIVPVIGARTPAQLSDALGALTVDLSDEAMARLEAALPPDAVAGTRYDAAHMQSLDSER
jgi:aryl-alcohol dehydrogenase-like predicted oxidoreductase